jgi:hypothetical protein
MKLRELSAQNQRLSNELDKLNKKKSQVAENKGSNDSTTVN